MGLWRGAHVIRVFEVAARRYSVFPTSMAYVDDNNQSTNQSLLP